jgi:hypothetical protein
LLTTEVIKATPSQLIFRYLSRHRIALPTAKRDDRHNQTTQVVRYNVEHQLKYGLEDQLSNETSWHRLDVFVSAQRPIVTDRRRRKAIDGVADAVTMIMSETPKMAAVRSTNLLAVSPSSNRHRPQTQ